MTLYIQPWNIKGLYQKFSISYKKTKLYEKTDLNTFKKEVFGYDKTLLDGIKEHIFLDKSGEYLTKDLGIFELGNQKKIKTKEGTIRDYDGDLKEGEEIIIEPIVVQNFFTESDFNEFFGALGFKGDKFNTIYDASLFSNSELIEIYKKIIFQMNKMYKGYIIYNEKIQTYYVFFMMKTSGELSDEGLNREELYKDIEDLNVKFYSKIGELVQNKYKEISALAPHDLGMLQLIKYQENFNKLIEEKKTQYKSGKHDLMIFNFYGKYSNFENYIQQYLGSDEFINDVLFKKIIGIL